MSESELLALVPALIPDQEGAPSASEAAPPAEKAEVESVFLSPEQIEEIHVDNYTLTLFYALRIQPMNVAEIKRNFPEPHQKKAQTVMERFVQAGLAQLNDDGRYHSSFPSGYVNYGKYRYDWTLERKKDSGVFALMKDHMGKKDYWRIRSYFSIDTFFTHEQVEELQGMFKEIKIKAKEFAEQNAKAGSLKNLSFYRLKFYNMLFSTLLVLAVSFGFSQNTYAGGGNDPTKISFLADEQVSLARLGGGNDPTAAPDESDCLSEGSVRLFNAVGTDKGGGGHDPTRTASIGQGGGGHDPTTKVGFNNLSCKLQTLEPYVKMCRKNASTFCKDVREQARELWLRLNGMQDI